MKNYVISLVGAADRRTHIIQEFGKQGVVFEFFDAITPKQVSSLAEHFKINIIDTELTKGELACLFSHICLWQKAIDDNLDHIAIFEDDIYLGENIKPFLDNTNWILSHHHMIKLEMFDSYRLMERRYTNVNHHRCLKRLKDIHLGAAGYILSQELCKELIKHVKTLHPIIPSDHILFEEYLTHPTYRPYQLIPALCVQSDRWRNTNQHIFASSLENDRRKRFDKKFIVEKKHLTLSQKILREMKRILIQIKVLIEKQPIPFR